MNNLLVDNNGLPLSDDLEDDQEMGDKLYGSLFDSTEYNKKSIEQSQGATYDTNRLDQQVRPWLLEPPHPYSNRPDQQAHPRLMERLHAHSRWLEHQVRPWPALHCLPSLPPGLHPRVKT